MKKILIGVCGLGNGHTTRQKNIIKRLIQRGHKIVLFVTADNKDIMDDFFPDLKKIVVKIPWIYCDVKGIDFKKTKNRYLVEKFDWYKEMLLSFIKVQTEFQGNPDIVITDYEPNSAQFSYATRLPLICLEQQSKFIGYKFNKIGKYSPNEEVSRLNYFFPTADKRYVSSFFPLKERGSREVESIPPIINRPLISEIDSTKVVVYFSPYGKKEKNFIEILDIIKNVKDSKFHICSAEKFPKYDSFNNLFFKGISNDFENDLKSCNYVISTAGHQLISEAINFEKPVLLSPFNTFEQNYNVKMVKKYSLGDEFKPVSEQKLLDFVAKVDMYRQKMHVFKKRYWKDSWDNILINKLELNFGL